MVRNRYRFFLFFGSLSSWLRMYWSWSTPCHWKYVTLLLTSCWRQRRRMSSLKKRLSIIHFKFFGTTLFLNEHLGLGFKVLTVSYFVPDDVFIVLGTEIYKFTFIWEALFYESWYLGGYLTLQNEVANRAGASVLEDHLIFLGNICFHRLKNFMHPRHINLILQLFKKLVLLKETVQK